MVEVLSVPLWLDPLPTKYTFIHFDEDVQGRSWLGRSVTCPSTFVPAAQLFEHAEWTPAAASACRRPLAGGARQSRWHCPGGHPMVHHLEEEEGSCDGCGSTVCGQYVMDCRHCNWYLCESCTGWQATARPEEHTGSDAPANATPAKCTATALVELEAPPSERELGSKSSVKILDPVTTERALPSGAVSSAVDASGGDAGRPDASESEGAWQVARSSRSSREARDRRQAPSVTDATDVNRQQTKDHSKWSVVQKGRHVCSTELLEEEDARTDATGSTGPGGEEVSSGASTSGKEQSTRAASAQPLQVSEASIGADPDGEAEDAPGAAEDGWTQVPARQARKRERKDCKELTREQLVEPSSAKPLHANVLRPSPSQRREAAAKSAAAKRAERADVDVSSDTTPFTQVSRGRASPTAAGPAAAVDLPSSEQTSTQSAGQQDQRPRGVLSRSGSAGEVAPKAEAAAWKGPGAWTLVKYKAGIKQEEAFNLMRRLLVPGGGHIKRIAKLTGAKLAVRGEGSGHHEGPIQKEVKSDEPLVICIWSAYASSLGLARTQVEELIVQLHEDYRAFCRKREFPVPVLEIMEGEVIIM